jgi:hypothetical protein
MKRYTALIIYGIISHVSLSFGSDNESWLSRPVSMAILNRNYDTFAALLDAGADPMIACQSGGKLKDALDLAIKFHHNSLVSLIVQKNEISPTLQMLEYTKHRMSKAKEKFEKAARKLSQATQISELLLRKQAN